MRMDDAGSRENLGERKRAARAEAAARRSAIGRERRADGALKVAARGLDFLHHGANAVVAAYVAFRDEIDPLPLLLRLAEDGARTALPCVVGRGEPLVFRVWKPGDELAGGAHGIPAPHGDAPLAMPQVLLVPLLAFDARGYRLGYGGGYYDRTLAVLRKAGTVTAVGLAFDEQEMPTVPHGAQDQRLDWVLTPSRVREFGTVGA